MSVNTIDISQQFKTTSADLLGKNGCLLEGEVTLSAEVLDRWQGAYRRVVDLRYSSR